MCLAPYLIKIIVEICPPPKPMSIFTTTCLEIERVQISDDSIPCEQEET